MAADRGLGIPRCVLDSAGSTSLKTVIEAFSNINEEQAWGVCFQCAKAAQLCMDEDPSKCFMLTDIEQVRVREDGNVDRSSFYGVGGPTDLTRKPVPTEYKLVAALGMVIYQVLDLGLPADEEKTLSSSLESLIDKMTSSGSLSPDLGQEDREADEGIEQDAGENDEGDRFSLQKVLELCANHLKTSSLEDAEVHYRNVCRALVREALDLTQFLDIVSQGSETLKKFGDNESTSEIDHLHFSDWARLWMQVVGQLREVVKLKKVQLDPNTAPIEYALTPYEILMDDIRSKRYKLNKIMVDGKLPPKVKKDAHAFILEFIRSRPPLKRAQDRPQKPKKKESCLHDMMMEEIRSSSKEKLRHAPTVETSRTKFNDSEPTPEPRRRLLQAEDALARLPNFEDDDSDDDLSDEEPSQNQNGGRHQPKRRESTESSEGKVERRHSISVCQYPTPRPRRKKSHAEESPNSTSYPTKFQDVILNSSLWEEPIDYLSLTLEEVVHIRTVLTRADLETLLFDLKLYNAVAKGQICFSCRKTKLSILSSLRKKCRLCEQRICAKCCSKMNIPVEHFSRIPVFALSPTSPSEEETPTGTSRSGAKSFLSRLSPMPAHTSKFTRNLAGSAPNSPRLSGLESNEAEMNLSSLPNSNNRKLCGELMTVCTDCKVMVRQIILSSRKQEQRAKRASPARPSHLNLRNISTINIDN